MDRELQQAMLQKLAECYPGQVHAKELCDDRVAANRNLIYLAEHGLVENKSAIEMGRNPVVILSKITARGLDFIADDGGLSAILGTVTVKLHADTVRELVEARIAASDLPKEEKSALSDALRSVPAEGLKHLTTRLLDMALDRLPEAMPLLLRMLQSGA